MEIWKRVIIFATFISFAAGIALISAALATDNWIIAKPIRFNSSGGVDNFLDGLGIGGLSSQNSPTEYESMIKFGLFNGLRKLNYGLGSRPVPFNIREEIKTGTSFMSIGLWVTTILFAALAMLWAVIGAIFSLINTVIIPYETLTGPLGLYLWSCLAVLCTFISTIVFVVQYFVGIAQNVLLSKQTADGWTSEGLAWFDYSFWLMIGAMAVFAANIFLLLLSGIEMKTNMNSKEKSAPLDSGAFMY